MYFISVLLLPPAAMPLAHPEQQFVLSGIERWRTTNIISIALQHPAQTGQAEQT
jgi:hypothetical protein